MDIATLEKRKYLILIVTLIVALIVESFSRRLVVSDALLALTVAAVLPVVFKGWRDRAIAFATAAAANVANWTHYVILPTDEYHLLQAAAFHGLLAFFLAFTVAVILRNIFADKLITPDKVLGAACGYLLGAGMWANVYAVTDLLIPGSFITNPQLVYALSNWHTRPELFEYFSLVTLTTMGYGDVTPVQPPATVLASLEAVFGQFYIAVVVAALVGARLAQAFGPNAPPTS